MAKREWKTLAEVRKGTDYGHRPGLQYHDVDVAISARGNKFPETAACPEREAEGAGREELAIEVRPCPVGYQAVATNRYDGAPDGDRRVGYGATPAEAEAALRELYDC